MKKAVVVIIIMLGAFLLLDNMGFFVPFIRHIVISWQALLIGIGVVLLFGNKSNIKSTGIILTIIGVLFLLPKIFSVSVSGFVFPLILIIVAIIIYKGWGKDIIAKKKEKETIPNICPHCKNPNTKKLQECEWCGNRIY